MIDRGNAIIRTIETKIKLAESSEQHEIWITLDVMREILDLLKKQESIVRCKDCKHGIKITTALKSPYMLCIKPYSGSPLHDIDYYCADGKRR